MGALGFDVGSDVSPLAVAAAEALNEHLPRFLPTCCRKNIAHWNDASTWEDVESTFRAAIAATAPQAESVELVPA